MRHSPLDGPDSGYREGKTPADGTPDDDVEGFVGRLRGVLGMVTDTVRGLAGASGHRDRDVPTERPTRLAVEGTKPTDDRGSVADRPVVVDRQGNSGSSSGPVREGSDRPELLARFHDGRLTLAEPDEAGAQMSSDVWSDVDP